VLAHGQATWDEALLLFPERSGFAEETYHTFSYSPVYDDDSRIAGMLCVVTEVTERVIGERHLRVLRDLAARASGLETVQQAADRLIGVLTEDLLDVPFACLYVIDPASSEGRLASHYGEIPERLRSLTVWRPAPMTISSSPSWRASCWRESTHRLRWRACAESCARASFAFRPYWTPHPLA